MLSERLLQQKRPKAEKLWPEVNDLKIKTHGFIHMASGSQRIGIKICHRVWMEDARLCAAQNVL